MTSLSSDVVIIGAGAAGLMCAIEAGKRGKSVILIDHAKAVGEKIRISGGGRCNFTNIHTSAKNFLSQNPHFAKSALARYKPDDFIKLVETYDIPFYEKTLGQLFCQNKSLDIINMLITECTNFGVEIHLNTSIDEIKKTQTGYALTSKDREYNCPSLVIATGGKSIPKMGSTGFGYSLAKELGLNVIKPRPALVPLTFDQTLKESFSKLSGVSLEVEVTCNKGKFKEALLFTHRGLSGPAILQISSYWNESDDISLNILPGENIKEHLLEARKSNSKQTLLGFLSNYFPNRFSQYLILETGLSENQNLVEISNNQFEIISNAIHQWRLKPQGTEGFRTAEVTIGGVNTNEISSKTFETKKHKGLYFIGEVLDVTGHLGGFNFQWAWASGFCAGQYV